MSTTNQDNKTQGLPPHVVEELAEYEEWIKKYRAGQIGEIKMQKIRLQLGTYHQRQSGVQMERIKFPGGTLTSEQLVCLADTADKYASGFIHFTTRTDAQLYYIKLEDCPDMMRMLARGNITTREACGNTVRNITASYRSGVAPDEIFDVVPYAEALYRHLVRNKYNQVMGRKFKIAFESSATDIAGMLYHDFGFQAAIKNGKRGFRVFIAGGLGGVPMLGHLYTDFLPEEELLHFGAATVRLFDRYGERKNRMAARMKFMMKKFGLEKFKELLETERKSFKTETSANDYLKEARKEKPQPKVPSNLPENPDGVKIDGGYQTWLEDNVIEHKYEGFKGVHVRLKLGDLLSDPARELAKVAATFSQSELRISLHQNLFLPWVPEQALPALYVALKTIGLADPFAETMADTTTCPGADTCRLGITSAKGLGSAISDGFNNGLSRFKEVSKDLKVKISGCPNGCAQHGMANIGFQGAALKKDGKTVPSHELFLGGGQNFESTSLAGRIGKFPARNCPKVVEELLELYTKQKQDNESFNDCMKRIGKDNIVKHLAPLAEIPSFETDPSFYEDWGHENEKFAVRTGIKGECAGAPVQEKVPVISEAEEKLNQAVALVAHGENANAQIEAFEATAHASRVPLYANFVDPFTSEQAIWEFENIFVLSGKVKDDLCKDLTENAVKARDAKASEKHANEAIEKTKKFIEIAKQVHAELTAK